MAASLMKSNFSAALRKSRIKNGIWCRHFGQPVPKTHPHLLKEGQVTPGITESEYRRKFCPHHVGHYLGMDVHDTPIISRRINLEPGMVVTIEPGIYISETNMKVPAEFRGIGIRIEDNMLITDSSPIILSCNCPKTVEDIEDVMASKRT